MSNFLKHYSVDISHLTSDEQDKILKRLEMSCWNISQTNTPGVFDIFWETQRGNIYNLPFLPENCVILPQP